MRKLLMVFLNFSLILTLASCTDANASEKSEVIVFAAASLTDSLNEIASDFEKDEGENVKVILNLAGSQVLKTSITQGAKADIFVSANLKQMDELKTGGFVKEYKVLLKNKLVIIKNKKSAYSIKKLGDLGAKGLKISIGDVSVPIGDYWAKALEAANAEGIISVSEKQGIEKNVVTRELSVKDIVSKVLLGEADTGIVYRSDVTPANTDKVEAVEIPLFDKFIASYPAAIVEDSGNSEVVTRFYSYLYSHKVKQIFKKYKFIIG